MQDENHLFWDEHDVNAKLEKIMKRSFDDVLKIHLDKKVNMRLAANMLGVSPSRGSLPRPRSLSVNDSEPPAAVGQAVRRESLCSSRTPMSSLRFSASRSLREAFRHAATSARTVFK